MLSEAPQVHDFVHHNSLGNGVITEVGNLVIVVDFPDDDVFFDNPPEDDELSHRFTTCKACHYDKILGRPCGEPCV